MYAPYVAAVCCRIEYFTQYLHQLDRAIQEGAQIKGYFAWSLMDNFEYVLYFVCLCTRLT